MKGVSVIIPSVRSDRKLAKRLGSVCASLDRFEGPKELLICLDRPGRYDPSQDFLHRLMLRYPFIRILRNLQRLGAPATRLRGIREARFEVLLFTDDDCLVPRDWVESMHALVVKYGVVTGPITALVFDPHWGCFWADLNKSVYPRLEELVDHYRATAVDSAGNSKFMSFGNSGILRSLLPPIPFDGDFRWNADDMDLGCRLRLLGARIHVEHGLIVRTVYPKSFPAAVKRKIRHAIGIAHVHRQLGNEAWERLEMGSHARVISRWIDISFRARIPLAQRLLFCVINLSYSMGLLASYYALGMRENRSLKAAS